LLADGEDEFVAVDATVHSAGYYDDSAIDYGDVGSVDGEPPSGDIGVDERADTAEIIDHADADASADSIEDIVADNSYTAAETSSYSGGQSGDGEGDVDTTTSAPTEATPETTAPTPFLVDTVVPAPAPPPNAAAGFRHTSHPMIENLGFCEAGNQQAGLAFFELPDDFIMFKCDGMHKVEMPEEIDITVETCARACFKALAAAKAANAVGPSQQDCAFIQIIGAETEDTGVDDSCWAGETCVNLPSSAVDSAAPATAVSTTTNSDESTTTTYTDGSSATLSDDGTTIAAVGVGGSTTTTKVDDDGSITTSSTDGASTTFGADGRTTTAVGSDGSTTITVVNQDGSVIVTDADGNTQIFNPETNADGDTTVTLADGTTVTVSADDSTITTVSPDGSSTTATTNADGSTTTKVTQPDGSSTTATMNADGTITLTNTAAAGVNAFSGAPTAEPTRSPTVPLPTPAPSAPTSAPTHAKCAPDPRVVAAADGTIVPAAEHDGDGDGEGGGVLTHWCWTVGDHAGVLNGNQNGACVVLDGSHLYECECPDGYDQTFVRVHTAEELKAECTKAPPPTPSTPQFRIAAAAQAEADVMKEAAEEGVTIDELGDQLSKQAAELGAEIRASNGNEPAAGFPAQELAAIAQSNFDAQVALGGLPPVASAAYEAEIGSLNAAADAGVDAILSADAAGATASAVKATATTGSDTNVVALIADAEAGMLQTIAETGASGTLMANDVIAMAETIESTANSGAGGPDAIVDAVNAKMKLLVKNAEELGISGDDDFGRDDDPAATMAASMKAGGDGGVNPDALAAWLLNENSAGGGAGPVFAPTISPTIFQGTPEMKIAKAVGQGADEMETAAENGQTSAQISAAMEAEAAAIQTAAENGDDVAVAAKSALTDAMEEAGAKTEADKELAAESVDFLADALAAAESSGESGLAIASTFKEEADSVQEASNSGASGLVLAHMAEAQSDAIDESTEAGATVHELDGNALSSAKTVNKAAREATASGASPADVGKLILKAAEEEETSIVAKARAAHQEEVQAVANAASLAVEKMEDDTDGATDVSATSPGSSGSAQAVELELMREAEVLEDAIAANPEIDANGLAAELARSTSNETVLLNGGVNIGLEGVESAASAGTTAATIVHTFEAEAEAAKTAVETTGLDKAGLVEIAQADAEAMTKAADEGAAEAAMTNAALSNAQAIEAAAQQGATPKELLHAVESEADAVAFKAKDSADANKVADAAEEIVDIIEDAAHGGSTTDQMANFAATEEQALEDAAAKNNGTLDSTAIANALWESEDVALEALTSKAKVDVLESGAVFYFNKNTTGGVGDILASGGATADNTGADLVPEGNFSLADQLTHTDEQKAHAKELADAGIMAEVEALTASQDAGTSASSLTNSVADAAHAIAAIAEVGASNNALADVAEAEAAAIEAAIEAGGGVADVSSAAHHEDAVLEETAHHVTEEKVDAVANGLNTDAFDLDSEIIAAANEAKDAAQDHALETVAETTATAEGKNADGSERDIDDAMPDDDFWSEDDGSSDADDAAAATAAALASGKTPNELALEAALNQADAIAELAQAVADAISKAAIGGVGAKAIALASEAEADAITKATDVSTGTIDPGASGSEIGEALAEVFKEAEIAAVNAAANVGTPADSASVGAAIVTHTAEAVTKAAEAGATAGALAQTMRTVADTMTAAQEAGCDAQAMASLAASVATVVKASAKGGQAEIARNVENTASEIKNSATGMWPTNFAKTCLMTLFFTRS
jgi:hypothetical protein